MDDKPAAVMTLEEVVNRLAEAGVGFMLIHFPDNKPSRRFGARCSGDDKFYASDAAGALLHAIAHVMREGRERIKEGETILAANRTTVAQLEASLPNVSADFISLPDGKCSQCGTFHKATEKAAASEALGGLGAILAGIVTGAQRAPRKDDEDDEDKEN